MRVEGDVLRCDCADSSVLWRPVRVVIPSIMRVLAPPGVFFFFHPARSRTTMNVRSTLKALFRIRPQTIDKAGLGAPVAAVLRGTGGGVEPSGFARRQVRRSARKRTASMVAGLIANHWAPAQGADLAAAFCGGNQRIFESTDGIRDCTRRNWPKIYHCAQIWDPSGCRPRISSVRSIPGSWRIC